MHVPPGQAEPSGRGVCGHWPLVASQMPEAWQVSIGLQGTQPRHAVAPPVAKVPDGQLAQELAPSTEAKVPAGQGVHAAAPAAAE
jgi:hypothetical protein